MAKKVKGGSDVPGSNLILPSKLSSGTYDVTKIQTAVKGGNCGMNPQSILKGGRRRKSKKNSTKRRSRKTVKWFW
jgi:hypothetical protein